MEGLELKSTGFWYEVLSSDNKRFVCRTRGKLRLKGFKTTNPIAVGDHVVFDVDTSDDAQGIITEILPRENYIIRKSIKKTSHGHILAANIDQAVLIATVKLPKTSLGFIDRFLITAESFRIPQVIVFNKTDLHNTNDDEILKDIIKIYDPLGIKCLKASAKEQTGLEAIKDVLSNKKSLVSGHSGVGKSSLLNLLAPNINQTVNEVSDFSAKGVHTTTFAEMFELDSTSFVIDTPGIKELGLIDIEEAELSDYFVEMRTYNRDCKFHNCTHTHEPKCAVKQAVIDYKISEERYDSYLSMFYEKDTHR